MYYRGCYARSSIEGLSFFNASRIGIRLQGCAVTIGDSEFGDFHSGRTVVLSTWHLLKKCLCITGSLFLVGASLPSLCPSPTNLRPVVSYKTPTTISAPLIRSAEFT